MSVQLTINGVTYDYPETGNEGWGEEATNWAIAVDSQHINTSSNVHGLTQGIVAGTTQSQTFENKSLKDNTVFFIDDADATKKLGFELVDATASTVMTLIASQTADQSLTLPNTTDTLVANVFPATLQSKTLDNTNNATLLGSNFTLQDDTDNTKRAVFDMSLITTATTDTFRFPSLTSGSDTLVSVQEAQNLLNKSLDDSTTIIEGVLSSLRFDLPGVGDIVLQMAGPGGGSDTIYMPMSTSTTKSTASKTILLSDLKQLVTNKDIDGTTASDDSRITVPKDIKANLDALTRKEGTVVFASDEKNLYVDDGTDLKIVGAGLGLKVDLYDPVSTTKPPQTTTLIDGVTIVDGDTVLFSNLTSGNNTVNTASVSGTAITWTQEKVFDGQLLPTDGDFAQVLRGDSFADRKVTYDGAAWLANNTIRYFNGSDYWEQDSIREYTLADNSNSGATAPIFSLTSANSENLIVDYSMKRGVRKETGQLLITVDTSTNTAEMTRVSTNKDDLGITLSVTEAAGTLTLDWVTDASGNATVMKYMIKRWSDSTGGPGGTPSYSGSVIAAAGSVEEIQFHGTDGKLASDSNLGWDNTNKELKLGGMRQSSLSGVITIPLNTTDFTLITLNATAYPYSVIEYSLAGGGHTRVGTQYLTTNGTLATTAGQYTSTDASDMGITLKTLSPITGGNVLLRADETLGNSVTFKYTIKKWA